MRVPFAQTLSLCVCVLLLTCTQPLLARLGDKPAELEQEFGAPQKCDDTFGAEEYDLMYRKDGWIFMVGFLKDRSCYEAIRRDDGAPIEAKDVRLLLERNARDYRWNENRPVGQDFSWARDDLQATARYYAESKILVVVSKEFLETTWKARKGIKSKLLPD